MKNKKSVYILLPIVLLIWGMLIYQFFSYSVSDPSLENTSTEFNVKPLKVKERTPFAVNVAYRDPFLGKMYIAPVSIQKKSSNTTKKSPKLEETIVWPLIHYRGMISDPKEKNKVFIMTIEGHDYFMKKGDTENEVFLKDGDKESVYVKYKGNLNLIMMEE
jgi:uncharacterized cupredoxin-like copper-binding protein